MKNLLLVFFLSISLSAGADIHKIPKNDLKNIKNLFEMLILEHDFGYTIFGSKPMALTDVSWEPVPNLPILRKLVVQIQCAKIKRRINSWYKYKNEFDFKDFIFLDKDEWFKNSPDFVLINKKNLFSVLLKHESIFKEELGDSFRPELFLEKLENRETSLADAIHRNQRLLGIMLGYGERNATLFQKRFGLMMEIMKREREGLPEDEELNAKFFAMEAEVDCFSEFEEEAILPPLYFVSDNSHPESIALKNQYTQDKRMIENLMKDPKFKDMVLQRLVEHQVFE